MIDNSRATEYERLRASAIRAIGDTFAWSAADYLPGGAMVALSGYDDARWINWSDVTGAQDGDWFVWSDGPEDIHVDQVIVEDGKIIGKHGCGLDYYPVCQPCRFADDVKEAIERGRAKEIANGR